jgi:hypothetical protein
MKNRDISLLANEIKHFSCEVAKSLAIMTRDKLYEDMDNIITKFYKHYPNPLYYKRHIVDGGIGGNVKRSFKKYYMSSHETTYSGGISLSPEWMEDIYNNQRKNNRVSTDYIFNLIYAGYHGNIGMLPWEVSNIPPVMNPSPWELILRKRDNLVKNAQKNGDLIINKIKKNGKYSFIS